MVGASLWFAPRFTRLPAGSLAVGGYALSACALWLVSHAEPGPQLVLLHAVAGIGVGCALFAVGFYALAPKLMAARGPDSVFLVIAGLMACAAVACLWFPGHSVRELKVMQAMGREPGGGPGVLLRWPLVAG